MVTALLAEGARILERRSYVRALWETFCAAGTAIPAAQLVMRHALAATAFENPTLTADPHTFHPLEVTFAAAAGLEYSDGNRRVKSRDKGVHCAIVGEGMLLSAGRHSVHFLVENGCDVWIGVSSSRDATLSSLYAGNLCAVSCCGSASSFLFGQPCVTPFAVTPGTVCSLLVDCEAGSLDVVSENSGRVRLLAAGPFVTVCPCVIFCGPSNTVVTILSVGGGGMGGLRPRTAGLQGDGCSAGIGAGAFGNAGDARSCPGDARAPGGGRGGGGSGGSGGSGGAAGSGGDGGSAAGSGSSRGASGIAPRTGLSGRIAMVFSSPYAEYNDNNATWEPVGVSSRCWCE